jgi:hypothetical protein
MGSIFKPKAPPLPPVQPAPIEAHWQLKYLMRKKHKLKKIKMLLLEEEKAEAQQY